MSSAVLDASALLAMLADEPGAQEAAEAVAAGAAMSAVNLSEVVAKLTEHELSEEEAREVLAPLSLEIVAFDQEHAWRAGALRLATRGHGLSLGDRACLSLGVTLGLPVLTTDRAWKKLPLEVEVRVLRGK
ncbi:MAG TPA: type II toxin-antitoxin system VapC family toxin [Myxococcales bacterium]